MILGIVAIVFSFIPVLSYFAWLIGVIGIILAALGLKESKLNNGEGKGMAVAGLVCSIIATAFGVIGLICAIACVAAANSYGTALGAALMSAGY